MFDYLPVRELFPLGPFVAYTWGLFVALGIFVAACLGSRRSRRFGIPPEKIWNVAFAAAVAGFIGARLLYVVEYARDFAAEPWRVFAVWEGGMSAYGALLLGAAASCWYARRQKIPLRRLAAALSLPFLLGDAIGRLGGAASHMYPGRPTAFPISYVLDGVRRHEVGIELSFASLLGFFVISGLERITRGKASDFTASAVLLWYSLARLLLDFLRAADLPNSDIRYGGLTLAQYFAIAGLFLGLVLLTRFLARRA